VCGEFSLDASKIAGGAMQSILDPSFRYTTSLNTDLQKTFARIRHDHRQAAAMATHSTTGWLATVSSIDGRTGPGADPITKEFVQASVAMDKY
jgi:hypothetical protein